MGYVLKRGKISEIAPNHPFAHEQISFVPRQEFSSSNSSERQSNEPSSAAQHDPKPTENALLRCLEHVDSIRARLKTEFPGLTDEELDSEMF